MLQPFHESIDDLVFVYGHAGRGDDPSIYSIAASIIKPGGQVHDYASHIRFDKFTQRERYRSNLSKAQLARAPLAADVRQQIRRFLGRQSMAFAFADRDRLTQLADFCDIPRIVDLHFCAEYFLQALDAHTFNALWECVLAQKRDRISFSAAESVRLSMALVEHICGTTLNDQQHPESRVLRYYLEKSDTLFGRAFVSIGERFRSYFGGLFNPFSQAPTGDWQTFLEQGRPEARTVEEGSPIRPLAETEIKERFEKMAAAGKGFNLRTSQVDYALEVARALNEKAVLCIEAGTGTGKTQGYLTPVMDYLYRNPHAGVAISTYTKSLQSQILQREIAFTKSRFPIYREIPTALLKGKSSYLCAEKVDALYEEADTGFRLLAWLFLVNNIYHYRSADVDTIGETVRHYLNRKRFLAHALEAASAADGCSAKHSRCPAQFVSAAALAARLIVTNHYKLALLDQEPALYKLFRIYIIDEANHFEAAVRNAFRVEASSLQLSPGLEYLEKRLNDFKGRLSNKSDDLIAACLKPIATLRTALFDMARGLFLLHPKAKQREEHILSSEDIDRETLEIRAHFHQMRTAIAVMAKNLTDLWEQPDLYALNLAGRVGKKMRAEANLLAKFSEALQHIEDCFHQENSVLTYVLLGKHFVLCASPVEVADIIRENIYQDKDCIVYTAAALCEGRRFDRFNEIVGLNSGVMHGEHADGPKVLQQAVIPSPFSDTAMQIVVPKGAVSGRYANKPAWLESVVKALPELIASNKGRTLVLFSSYGDLIHVAQKTADEIVNAGYPLLIQQAGQPTIHLCDEFRMVKESVLFGVDTFWYGVDFPGDTLTQVIVTRIPYPSPGSPVQTARKRLLSPERYWKQFRYLTAIKLKQGIGRLIRSENDSGRVVVLDRRYNKQFYP